MSSCIALFIFRGNLSIAKALDREVRSSYDLAVTVTDNSGLVCMVILVCYV